MHQIEGQSVNAQGHLEIGGVDTVSLAENYGTPLIVFDEELVRRRMRTYLQICRDHQITSELVYAAKAFLTAGFCQIVDDVGLHLDVASGGELYTALAGGFPADRIVMHGNNKSWDELDMAVRNGVGRIVVDNFLEISLLESVCQKAGRKTGVVVRVSPGIDPDTHELVSTGQVDTKFGFDIASGAALKAVNEVFTVSKFDLLGVHCQVGSQMMDLSAHGPAIDQMVDFMVSVRDNFGIHLPELNIGGGLGIAYTPDESPPSVEEFCTQVYSTFRAAIARTGLTEPAMWQEPGRYLVAEAGTTLYRLGARKDIPGCRTYVSVDGGMSDNIRPCLYGSRYSAVVANKADHPNEREFAIAGKHCETDVLIREISLPEIETGDLLAVQCTGAYTYSMASNYNRMPRPAVVAIRGGVPRLLVRREDYKDLLQFDVY